MKKLRLIAIGLSLTLVTCSSEPTLLAQPAQATAPGQTGGQGHSYKDLQGAGFEDVIIPEGQAPQYIQAMFGRQESAYWTLSQDDILRMEEQLKIYLQNVVGQNVLKDLSSYKRQYIGVVKEESKLLLGNYFCEASGIDWKQQSVIVDDGGNCYFPD
jgi:hypothetical protein